MSDITNRYSEHKTLEMVSHSDSHQAPGHTEEPLCRLVCQDAVRRPFTDGTYPDNINRTIKTG